MENNSVNAVKTISVVGLGYVGLPTSLAFHDAGYRVFGIDKNQEILDILNSGNSHLSDSSHDLIVPRESERWSVGADFSKFIPNSDVVLICVPTPTHKNKKPNLSFVKSAFSSVIKNVRKDKKPIIVLESTVYPGITNKIADEIAEVLFLNPEEDFSLAYSPERISPGDIGKSASDVARIVGSNDPMVGAELAEMYSKITAGGCTHVGPIEVAEAAKMVENTQRDIDIAFVNELAVVLPKMGVDVKDVLDAAETKWNFHRHDPGIGVGGHCIPVDPYYYIQFSEMAGSKSMMSPIAREINESMPKHAAGIISSKLPDRGGILILGTSYKPNVGDIRETPVFPLIRELLEAGFRVHAWDPINQEDDYLPNGCKHHISILDVPKGISGVVLATAHKECLSLDWGRLLSDIEGSFIFDGPRSLDSALLEKMGWDYSGVGFPL